MTNTEKTTAKISNSGYLLRVLGFLLLTLSTFITMFLYAVVIRFAPIPSVVITANAVLYNLGLLLAAIGFIRLQSITQSGTDLAVVITLFLAVGVSLLNMIPQMGVARVTFELLSLLYFIALAVRVFPQNKGLTVLLIAAFVYQLVTSLFSTWIIETVGTFGIPRLVSLFRHGMRLADVICCVLCLLAVRYYKEKVKGKK